MILIFLFDLYYKEIKLIQEALFVYYLMTLTLHKANLCLLILQIRGLSVLKIIMNFKYKKNNKLYGWIKILEDIKCSIFIIKCKVDLIPLKKVIKFDEKKILSNLLKYLAYITLFFYKLCNQKPLPDFISTSTLSMIYYL